MHSTHNSHATDERARLENKINQLNITASELKMATKDVVDRSELVEIKSDVDEIGQQVPGMAAGYIATRLDFL